MLRCLQEAQSLDIPAINLTGEAAQWMQFGFRPEVVSELNAWSVITHELVRQVYVHCEERGTLLARARARLFQVRCCSSCNAHNGTAQGNMILCGESCRCSAVQTSG